MRVLRDAGFFVGLIGVVLLLGSAVGSGIVLEDYSEARPYDDTGPCEGSGRDAEACNSLRLFESLWIPGWILLFLGVVIAAVGIYKSSRAEPQVQQPGYPCPTCNRPMAWVARYKRWFCRYCQKYG